MGYMHVLAPSAALTIGLGLAAATPAMADYPDVKFTPTSGPIGTTVTATAACDPGTDRVLMKFYRDDAFESFGGRSGFHEGEGRFSGGTATGSLVVGPTKAYTPGTGAAPEPDVNRPLKAGDTFRIEILCYDMDLSAYPWNQAQSKGVFTVTEATKPALTSKKSVRVKGKARVGKTLKAKVGSWSAKPDKVSYRWLRDGKRIKGAKSSSYKLVGRDAGKTVAVQVRATKSGYSPSVQTSKAVQVKA